jgi:putative C-S lyase
VHDFTTLVDRTPMAASKWVQMHRTAERAGAAPLSAGIAPLSVADLDLPLAPEIRDGLREALEDFVLGYTAVTDRYREVVATWLRHRHGWEVPPEWVEHTPGIIAAFTLAIDTFSAPGDGVIVQTPAYYPFFRSIGDSGREIVRNPLVEVEGRWRIDLDLLERQAQDPRHTILLFASPHNPTGRVWEQDELEAVARIALENDLLVISDEIHHDLLQPGHEHTVLADLGKEVASRSIVLTSASKSFNLAGLQLGNTVIPDEDLRRRFVDARDRLGFDNPNALGTVALELAYTRAAGWLDDLIDLVGHNHRVLTERITKAFPEARVADLEGTFLAWVDLRGLGLDAEELRRRNEAEALLYLDEGTVFGPEGAGFERFNIATPTAVLEAALDRMVTAYGR